LGKTLIDFILSIGRQCFYQQGYLCQKNLNPRIYLHKRWKDEQSVGNVIDPFELAREYGVEALRYYILSQIPIDADGEFTLERFKEVYNADLANGLGNLVARVAKLCETSNFKQTENKLSKHIIAEYDEYLSILNEYRFNDAISLIWDK